jgi:hypothetical protein
MNFFFLLCLLSILNSTFSLPKNVNRNNPVLLISLDGFRASKLNEFLNEYPNSTLKRQFVDVGVKADSVYKFYIIFVILI